MSQAHLSLPGFQGLKKQTDAAASHSPGKVYWNRGDNILVSHERNANRSYNVMCVQSSYTVHISEENIFGLQEKEEVTNDV